MSGDPEVAQLRLLELYDDTYGFIDHDTDPSPFSLVSQVEQEDSLLVSGFGGYVDEYLEARIYELTGITLDVWMTYTHAKQQMIKERAVRYGNKNDAKKLEGMSELEKTLKAINPNKPA